MAGQWFGYYSAVANATINRTEINRSGSYPCPINGKITKYRTWFGAVSGNHKFKVYRLVSGNTYHCVGEGAVTASQAGQKEYTLSTPISVKAGDVIGLWANQTVGMDKIRSNAGKNALREAGNQDATVCNNLTLLLIANYSVVLQAFIEPEPSGYMDGFVFIE